MVGNGGSRNFKTLGMVPAWKNPWGLGNVLMPLPVHVMFGLRVTNKRNIVILHIDDNQSLCKCYAIKIYNNKKSFQTGWGWGARCAAHGSTSMVLAFWPVLHLNPPAHG